MKKVLIIVSAVVIALAGIGVGAYFLTREKSPEQQVVGTWYDGENDVTIELKSNKSLKITKESGESRTGTWRIAGDKIKFTATSGPKAEGELSTGKIESIFFEFTNTNVSYALHDATYEKQ